MHGLALTKRTGECIRIGDSLVKIVSVRGQNVRLLIDAPSDVYIDRDPLTGGGSLDTIQPANTRTSDGP